jgi:hypothetical protein
MLHHGATDFVAEDRRGWKGQVLLDAMEILSTKTRRVWTWFRKISKSAVFFLDKTELRGEATQADPRTAQVGY